MIIHSKCLAFQPPFIYSKVLAFKPFFVALFALTITAYYVPDFVPGAFLIRDPVLHLEEEHIKGIEEATKTLKEIREKRKEAEKEAEDLGRCPRCNDSFNMRRFDMSWLLSKELLKMPDLSCCCSTVFFHK